MRITNVKEDSVVQQLGTELISHKLVIKRKWSGKRKDEEETMVNSPNHWYSLNKDHINILLANHQKMEKNPFSGGERKVRLHWELNS